MKQQKTLRLILGDQLNEQHSWFDKANEELTYLIMEMRSETDYVKHHVQKIVGFFLAMRAFKEILEKQGHRVIYLSLDDKRNQQSISKNISSLVKSHGFTKFEYLLPDEYRLDQELTRLKAALPIEVHAYDTEHFMSQRNTVADLFAGKKQFLMETFYRQIRKQYNVLMEADGKIPLTGRWNYDAENRKKIPKGFDIPEKKTFQRDTSDIVALLESQGVTTIGNIQATQFDWPVTRSEGLLQLKHFLEHCLKHFGRYQDAMTIHHDLLFHSRLSFLLNIKLISPLEVVQQTVAYWENHQDEIDLAQVEGFVRQIIGWREYMRGIYWAKMPAFAALNYFDHQAKLPSWFWTGKTHMRCLAHSITQSLDTAYAHHIQRLMVTGNFALLLGVHPDEVDDWYLGIYMDAIEWVEITNTRGMSQYADGGIVGTKPYISSANYIHKMGDYCSNCKYDRKAKTGQNACPFNSLYWDFYDRHQDKLGKNPRVGMMYRVWGKMSPEDQAVILKQADYYKKHVEEL